MTRSQARKAARDLDAIQETIAHRFQNTDCQDNGRKCPLCDAKKLVLMAICKLDEYVDWLEPMREIIPVTEKVETKL